MHDSAAVEPGKFTTSFALVEADRSVASFWRIVEGDFAISCSIGVRVEANGVALAPVASRCAASTFPMRLS